MQFSLVVGLSPLNEERRFYLGMPRVTHTPVKGDVEDIIKAKIDGVEQRCIGEAIEWAFRGSFYAANKSGNLIHDCFVHYAARPPNHKPLFRLKGDIGRQFHFSFGPFKPARQQDGIAYRRMTTLRSNSSIGP